MVGGVALALGLQGAKEWAADPSLHNYGRTPDPAVLLGAVDKLMVRIPLAQAIEGDVLIMAFASEPQHFAIISQAEPRYIIHAYAQARRVVEQGACVAKARTLRAYRFKDFA